jgi:L,D-transpeptidase ErfK/SrfK
MGMRGSTIVAAWAAAALLWIPQQPPRPAERPPEGAALSGGVFEYTVRAGDSLTSIGARHGIPATTIARDNGRAASGVLPIGTTLVLDNRHIVPAGVDRGILINVPQRMLFLFSDEGSRAYPVGLGRLDWPTPLGEFHVIIKETQPTWHVPMSIQEEMRRAGRTPVAVVPPGPDNPLGRFWIGLSIPAIGVHDTIAPSSVYSFLTHGCIRVHPDLVVDLFNRTAVGMRGRIVYEPVLVAASGNGIYLEVHPDVYRRRGEPLTALRALTAGLPLAERLDWTLAERVVQRREGVARDVTADQ